MAEKKTQLKIEVSVKDQATKAFETMGASIKRFGAGALASIAGFASRITGLGALLSGAGLVSLAKSSVELAQAVEDLAGAFGTTIESMSAVAAASKAYGVETDTLTTQLKAFAKVVEEAGEGSDKAVNTLRRLGVTAGQIRDAGDDLVAQFSLVADGFARLDGTAAKATTATELFGRQGIKMLELLGDGSEKFRNIIGEVESFGAVLDKEGAKKAVEVESAMAKLELRFQSMGRKLAENLVPVLAEAANKLLDLLIVEKTVTETVNTLDLSKLLGGLSKFQREAREEAFRANAPQPPKSQWDRMRDSMAGMKDPRADLERVALAMDQADERMLSGRARRAQGFANERKRELEKIKNDEIMTWSEKNRVIEGLEAEHARRMREIDGTVFQGLEDGLEEVMDKWADWYAQGREAAESFASGLQASFQAASQVLIQNIKDMEAAWKAFGEVFIRVLADMLVKLLAARLAGLVLNLIFPGGGQEGGSTGTTYRSATFNNQGPNTGGGGGGSGVGSGSGPQGFGGGGGGGGGGSPVTVVFNVNTVDARTFDQYLVERRRTIEDVVQTAVDKGHNRSLRLSIGRRA